MGLLAERDDRPRSASRVDRRGPPASSWLAEDTEVAVIALAGHVDPITVIALQREIDGLELYPTADTALVPSRIEPIARCEIAGQP